MEDELRDGLCDIDSIEELLSERSALAKTRGFFPSPLSNPLLPSLGIGTGGVVLRVGRVILFHFSFILANSWLCLRVGSLVGFEVRLLKFPRSIEIEKYIRLYSYA
jgi:hypothetical protein